MSFAMAPSHICRFCKCTSKNPCVVKGGFQGRCSWRDGACTICSAPECTEKYNALLVPALADLRSWTCACGCAKGRSQSFCKKCWNALPWELSGRLYNGALAGYACYYAEALLFLRECTTRFEGRTA